MNPADLPEFGKQVKIWPIPGRRAQVNERPVDAMGGGRWLSSAGEMVVWSPFHYAQMMGGHIMLHPPPCEASEFGEQSARGRTTHAACQACGRTIEEHQRYDAAAAPARALAAARAAAEAKLERSMTDEEVAAFSAAHARAQAAADAAPALEASPPPVPAAGDAPPPPKMAEVIHEETKEK